MSLTCNIPNIDHDAAVLRSCNLPEIAAGDDRDEAWTGRRGLVPLFEVLPRRHPADGFRGEGVDAADACGCGSAQATAQGSTEDGEGSEESSGSVSHSFGIVEVCSVVYGDVHGVVLELSQRTVLVSMGYAPPLGSYVTLYFPGARLRVLWRARFRGHRGRERLRSEGRSAGSVSAAAGGSQSDQRTSRERSLTMGGLDRRTRRSYD